MRIAFKTILVCIFVVGCSGNNSPTGSTTKSTVQNAWHSDDPWWNLNLSSFSPTSTSNVYWTTADNEVCTCASAASETNAGDSTAGSTTFSSCNDPSESPEDVPCSYWNGSWTWALSGSTLTICPSSGACVEMN